MEVGCGVGLGCRSDLLTPSRFGAAGWAEGDSDNASLWEPSFHGICEHIIARADAHAPSPGFIPPSLL